MRGLVVAEPSLVFVPGEEELKPAPSDRRIPTPEERDAVLQRLWSVEAAARAVAAVDFPGRALGERVRLKDAIRLLDEAMGTVPPRGRAGPGG